MLVVTYAGIGHRPCLDLRLLAALPGVRLALSRSGATAQLREVHVPHPERHGALRDAEFARDVFLDPAFGAQLARPLLLSELPPVRHVRTLSNVCSFVKVRAER
jgi:hypothetical protein